jgi:ABC-type multidrug transport system fused ATPase/permease subunit
LADNKKETSLYKISSVIRVLFGTAARKYPLFFVWESVKTIVSIAQPFITIMISPLIVDEIVGGQDLKKLIFYAAVLIICEFAATMLIEKSNSVLGKYQERLECYFDVLLGKQTMELDFQLTEDKEALDQLQKAKTGMSWYSGGVYGVAEQVFMFVGNIIKMAGLATVIILHAPVLLLILAVYAVFHFALTTKINKFAVASFNKLSKFNNMFGYFAWEVVDSRYGKDIRLYNAKDIILNAWKDNTKMQIDTWKWQADKEFPYDLLLEIAVFVGSMFTYFYVALLAIGGAFGIGVFTQLITAEGSLENTLFDLVWNVTELVKRCNYAYEYVVFMDYPAALPKGDKHIEKKDHEIEFRHVSFAYPKTDRKILDDISIKIRSGEHLSIVGLNGAGKTTFIKLLCRLYDPTEGEILVDGVNIKEYDYKEYMQQIAPVFQDFKLFAFSMGENIAFNKASNAKMSKYTDLVGLKDLVKKLDNGFNTNIFKYFDEKGIEPSGG